MFFTLHFRTIWPLFFKLFSASFSQSVLVSHYMQIVMLDDFSLSLRLCSFLFNLFFSVFFRLEIPVKLSSRSQNLSFALSNLVSSPSGESCILIIGLFTFRISVLPFIYNFCLHIEKSLFVHSLLS